MTARIGHGMNVVKEFAVRRGPALVAPWWQSRRAGGGGGAVPAGLFKAPAFPADARANAL